MYCIYLNYLCTLDFSLVPCENMSVWSQPTAAALKGAIQLGIGYAVGNLTSKPDRDVLMQDFYMVESVFLPRYSTQHWHHSAGFYTSLVSDTNTAQTL